MKDNQKVSLELNFKLIFELVKLRRKFLSLFIIISIAVVGIYSYIMPREFEASSSILPPEGNDRGGGLSSFLQSFSGGNLVLGNMGGGNQIKIFAEILQSRSVAEFIIEKNKIHEMEEFKEFSRLDLVKMISTMIEAELSRSGLLSLTANYSTGWLPDSEDEKQAALMSSKIANSAVQALDHVIRNKNISSAKHSRVYIENTLKQYRKDLDSLELQIEDYQEKNKILDPEEQTSAILKQTIDIGVQLAQAEIDLALAERQWNSSFPTVKAYKSAVEKIREQYMNVQSGGLTDDDSFSIPFDKIPEIVRIYTDMERNRKILEKVIMYLETQRHQEAIQEQKDIPSVEVLDEAVPPEKKSSPKRSLMLILTAVLSSIIAMFWIMISAYLKGYRYFENSEK